MARLTLRQIAAQAGVSHVAVSLALRNHPSISAATRERIQALAAKLGCRPNAYVSALMSEVRTRRVSGQPILALLNAWPERELLHRRIFHAHAIAGIQSRASELGFSAEEFWLHEPRMTPARTAKILRARGIDGVIVLGMAEPNSTLDFDFAQFASAACGTSLRHPVIHRATPALFDAMQLAVRQARAAGAIRIGLALTPFIDERNEERWRGAFLVAQRHEPPAGRLPPLFLRADEPERFLRWREKHRPDVIISSLSELPIPDWLARASLRAPRDVGLISLYAADAFPRAARVDANAAHIGAACVDLVVAQLHRNERGLPPFRKEVVIAPSWVGGATLAQGSTRRRARLVGEA